MQEESNTQGNEKKEERRNDKYEKIYDSNEYISAAKRVENGTVPLNILEFQYPFINNI